MIFRRKKFNYFTWRGRDDKTHGIGRYCYFRKKNLLSVPGEKIALFYYLSLDIKIVFKYNIELFVKVYPVMT